MFNAVFFDGELPNDVFISVYDNPTSSWHGWTQNTLPNPLIIHINLMGGTLTDREYNNTLAHEMVHVWQYVNGKKGGHGKSFKQKAKQINRMQLGVEINTKVKYTNK